MRRLTGEEQQQRVDYLIDVGVAHGVVIWPHLDLSGLSPTNRRNVMHALLDWLQAGRCGIRAGADVPLVLDHEPNGCVRGSLCRKCNNDEGRGYDWPADLAAMFTRWRQFAPAMWLRWPHPNHGFPDPRRPLADGSHPAKRHTVDFGKRPGPGTEARLRQLSECLIPFSRQAWECRPVDEIKT